MEVSPGGRPKDQSWRLQVAANEGECLAIADALHKAKHYVLVCKDLKLATNHMPLVGVFQKSLEDIENLKLFG